MLPPSQMMIVWILLFAVNIHNQRESLGMIMNDDGFVHIPQPPPALNIANEGAGPNIVC
jgi:hypothetical protein